MLNNVLCLAISEQDVLLIMNTLKRDLKFLNDNRLMDYSLLLGIERVNHLRQTQKEKSGPEKHRHLSAIPKKPALALANERSHSFSTLEYPGAKKTHEDSSFLLTIKQ